MAQWIKNMQLFAQWLRECVGSTPASGSEKKKYSHTMISIRPVAHQATPSKLVLLIINRIMARSMHDPLTPGLLHLKMVDASQTLKVLERGDKRPHHAPNRGYRPLLLYRVKSILSSQYKEIDFLENIFKFWKEDKRKPVKLDASLLWFVFNT